jgi:hypothetical protein
MALFGRQPSAFPSRYAGFAHASRIWREANRHNSTNPFPPGVGRRFSLQTPLPDRERNGWADDFYPDCSHLLAAAV